MAIGRNWLGAGLVLGFALAMVPVAAHARPAGEVAAMGNAIKAELAGPGSSIKVADITVKNARFEGTFATADVTGKTFDSPIVFLKKSGGKWKVIFTGSGTAAGDSQDIGFPKNSNLCRN